MQNTIYYLFIRLYSTRMGVWRTLGPTACSEMVSKKHVRNRHRKEKNLEPAAIRFTLEHISKFTRQSGFFLHANFMYLHPQESYRVVYHL